MDSKLFILPTNGNNMQPIYTNSVLLLRNKLRCDNLCRVAAVNCSNKGSDPQAQYKRVKFTDNSFDTVGIGQIPSLNKVTIYFACVFYLIFNITAKSFFYLPCYLPIWGFFTCFTVHFAGQKPQFRLYINLFYTTGTQMYSVFLINRRQPGRIRQIMDIFNKNFSCEIREFLGLKRLFLVLVTIVTLRPYSVNTVIQ